VTERPDLLAHRAVPRSYVKHPPGELAYEALVQTVRAYELTQRLFASQVAAIGLSLAEFDVLGTASDLGEASQSAIADQMLLSRAGIGKLVDRLERRGFLTRHPQPNDARVRLVRLTPAGRDILVKARVVQDEVIAATIGALSRGDQRALLEANRQIEARARDLVLAPASRRT
jgi:DNA-binding MarR family transcriptional regulator